MNLPPDSIATAQLLVGAVRGHEAERIASIIASADLPALAVTLAALVDDSKTVSELLAWNDGEHELDRIRWRRNLSDAKCAEFHKDYLAGIDGEDVLDGHREWDRRRKVRGYERRKGQVAS